MAIARVYEGLKRFGGSTFIAGVFHDEILVECDEDEAPAVGAVVESAMLAAMDALLNSEDPRVRIKVSGGISPVWTK